MAEEGWWQASQETVPDSLQFSSRRPLFHSAFPFFPLGFWKLKMVSLVSFVDSLPDPESLTSP